MDKKTKEELILVGILMGMNISIGVLVGLGPSFAILSPSIIGGIIAAVSTILSIAYLTYCDYKEDKVNRECIFPIFCMGVTSTAIGIGLGAAIGAIFPGVMLNTGSAVLMGATIGIIAPITGLIVVNMIVEPMIKKINHYIIEPVIEKIKECFSSKEA
ncbi:hypothetical protein [Wolbachia endosymbiont (group B) of Apotomis betuletana]|uniref:hypothetical protein n=1 Tax=Wolbachia endosymbiont (group B) of Apotomis betuletana TaxID=2953982 RepID=UPI00222625CE|nr:hypothetical protein [Wolbachia endosymbiont (group B) of Apotomis betuletana]